MVANFIPDGWEVKKLGDLVLISSSKRIFAREYVHSGIPFYRSKEIIQKQSGLSTLSELFISLEQFELIKLKYGVPQQGDLLLTSVGTIGVPYVVKNEVFYFKDGNLTWFKNWSGIESRFLYYWFLSGYGKRALSKIVIGSTQKAITINALNNMSILIPPLQKQQQIMSILSSLDNKIELLHEKNKTLEQLAEIFFQQCYSNGIGTNYRELRLGEITCISIGRTPPRKEQQWFSESDSDVKWISIKDLGSSGVFIFDTAEYLTSEAIKKFNIPIIPKDTVVLSFKMTVGRVGITTETMLSNEAIAHFVFDDNTPLSKEFLYLYLKNYQYDSLGSTSSIVKAINSTMIKNIIIMVPENKSMELFNDQVKPLFNKLKSNQIQIYQLECLRELLLPKLMSGEIYDI
ncbi:MAG: restriction endonuclease subunit S [Burkholderiales bacterium]|nr:restriction endonuclease subunit S [Burkholderiales bacterium]